MEIKFSTRSQFFDPIDEALRANKTALNQRQEILIELEGEGYPGEHNIVISEDEHGFEVPDLKLKDETRFPARIRAAATKLHELGYRGEFVISNSENRLSIRMNS